MNTQIVIGFLSTITATASVLVYLLYRNLGQMRRRYEETHNWALKLHSETADAQAKVAILTHHLTQERERNQALLRANFELTLANDAMSAQITGLYRAFSRGTGQDVNIYLN